MLSFGEVEVQVLGKNDCAVSRNRALLRYKLMHWTNHMLFNHKQTTWTPHNRSSDCKLGSNA
jgi:hypothetical protein